MPRKSVLKYPLFEIEQCSAENVRIYRVPGLRLYDTQEEKAHGPAIDLVRSLPGVAQASFKDPHTFVVRRSQGLTWQYAEPRLVDLLQGVGACSEECCHELALSPKSYASVTK